METRFEQPDPTRFAPPVFAEKAENDSPSAPDGRPEPSAAGQPGCKSGLNSLLINLVSSRFRRGARTRRAPPNETKSNPGLEGEILSCEVEKGPIEAKKAVLQARADAPALPKHSVNQHRPDFEENLQTT